MITDSAERPRRVSVSASTVTVFVRTAVMARHQRAVGKGVKVLDLNHYLEILLRKPGALPGATALAQARASGVFTPTHEAFWAAARKRSAMPPASGCWWRCCCCTATSRTLVVADIAGRYRSGRQRRCGRGRGPQSRPAARRATTAGRGDTTPAAGGQPHRTPPRRDPPIHGDVIDAMPRATSSSSTSR